MSLIAIQYRLVPEAPILVAANREEAYSRASLPPSIQSGKPRVLCGVDQQTRGSWLTVNQHGLFVAAANRPKLDAPIVPRSRGLLVRELARCQSSRQAVDVALDELSSDKYDGVNLIVADSESGWAIHGGDEPEAIELREGLSIIGNRNVNDPRDERVQLAHRLLTLQTLDSPVKFLAMASKVFARAPMHPDRPQMILRNANRGTVSSTLLALGKKPRDAIYQFAAGSPDETPYEDFSPLLRDILSRGLRESRMKAKA